MQNRGDVEYQVAKAIPSIKQKEHCLRFFFVTPCRCKVLVLNITSHIGYIPLSCNSTSSYDTSLDSILIALYQSGWKLARVLAIAIYPVSVHAIRLIVEKTKAKCTHTVGFYSQICGWCGRYPHYSTCLPILSASKGQALSNFLHILLVVTVSCLIVSQSSGSPYHIMPTIEEAAELPPLKPVISKCKF